MNKSCMKDNCKQRWISICSIRESSQQYWSWLAGISSSKKRVQVILLRNWHHVWQISDKSSVSTLKEEKIEYSWSRNRMTDKIKRKHNKPQNSSQKTKDRSTQTPLKPVGELRCARYVSSSYIYHIVLKKPRASTLEQISI